MTERAAFQMESDGDEFSDTYDHVSEDSLTAFERLKDSKVIITAQGEEDIKEEGKEQSDINHQLNLTIMNLQKNIEGISNRLKNLETKSSSKNGLWPFGSFILAYPIIAFLVMDRLRRKDAK
ncbi:uncharacterized protein LOC107359836 [Tetranychus urticae]|uniref:uncharacterized protein LOC107359836 n=1 Tax=Tetranychus urticae TaxID=32264 RepID=UPI00077B9E8F|nr:uncharacterized protein LOC107359836 [Tetranychus urticae]